MSVIDEYLNGLGAPEKKELQRVRKIVNQTVPDIEEVISYGMPVCKYKGKYLIGFAAFKNHMSLFPGANPVAKTKQQLSSFTLSKGTIQFTLDHPVPEAVIKDLVLVRKRDIDTPKS